MKWICLLLLLVVGCNYSPTGSMGVTVGGAQDIGYARQIIESGGVPDSGYIVAEGIYSEHDIPTPTGECVDQICLALGYGYATAVDDSSSDLFIQLGMTSTIRPEEFHRPHLQLALVIDHSGSMSGGSMEAVREALHRLVAKLTPEDEISIVEFDDEATLLMAPQRVTNVARIDRIIDGIEPDGSTDIEAGLALGYSQIAALPDRDGWSKRVMLFTDAMPNIGRTDRESFAVMTQWYADRKIGLTAFGVGIDFGQELVYHISKLRGGNFFFLESPDKIRSVFDTEFDYLVTPIAYDVEITVATPPGARLKQCYGLPGWKPGDRNAELHIPTLFLSSRRGAIVLRYEYEAQQLASGADLGTASIRYASLDNATVDRRLALTHAGGSIAHGDDYYSQEGTRLAVALTNVYLALRGACALHAAGSKAEALDLLARGIAAATHANTTLNDSGLAREIALMQKLSSNIH